MHVYVPGVSAEITNCLKNLVEQSIQFDINQSKSPNYYQSIKVIGVAGPHYLVAAMQHGHLNFLFLYFSSHSSHDRAYVHNKLRNVGEQHELCMFEAALKRTIESHPKWEIGIFSALFLSSLLACRCTNIHSDNRFFDFDPHSILFIAGCEAATYPLPKEMPMVFNFASRSNISPNIIIIA